MLLAWATEPEMVRMIEYLKAENRILQSKLPKRVEVTSAERAKLIKLGKRVGPAFKGLLTVVCYRTFTRCEVLQQIRRFLDHSDCRWLERPLPGGICTR